MAVATKHTSPIDVEMRKKADIRAGDTVRVWQKIVEGDKTRLQAFEGNVIARKHGREPGATFTVRKVASGVGVEKTFPLYSPNIDRVEIMKRAKVRRAKLYYIREKAARDIRKKMRQTRVEVEDVIKREEEKVVNATEEEAAEGRTEPGADSTKEETVKTESGAGTEEGEKT